MIQRGRGPTQDIFRNRPLETKLWWEVVVVVDRKRSDGPKAGHEVAWLGNEDRSYGAVSRELLLKRQG